MLSCFGCERESIRAASTTFKAIVGSGILTLPFAFKSFGLIGSAIGLCIAALFNFLTMRTLLLSIRHVRRLNRQRCAGARSRLRAEERVGNYSMHDNLLEEEEFEQVDGNPIAQVIAKESISYEDLGREALGKIGELIVLFSAITCQIGSCIAYTIFIVECIRGIIPFGGLEVLKFAGSEEEQAALLITPVLISLSWLRSAEPLEITSHFGNVALAFGLISVIIYGIREDHSVYNHDLDNGHSFNLFDLSAFPIFFGIAIFSYSAHCEIILIDQSLSSIGKTSKIYPRQILSFVITGIAILYSFFGGFCYLLYGKNVPDTGSIFKAMQESSILAKIVKSCMAISLSFQFPLTLIPALQMMERSLFGMFGTKEKKDPLDIVAAVYEHKNAIAGLASPVQLPQTPEMIEAATELERVESGQSEQGYTPVEEKNWCASIIQNSFRTVVVLGIVVTAVKVPLFSLVCALIGAFSNGIIVFILPPLFFFRFLYSKNENDKKMGTLVEAILNGIMFVVGGFACVYCSGDILMQIIQSLQHDKF
eukprot:g4454.t1